MSSSKVPFRLSPKAETSFQELKSRFTSILHVPDPNQQFVAEVDAPDVEVGAVLYKRCSRPEAPTLRLLLFVDSLQQEEIMTKAPSLLQSLGGCYLGSQSVYPQAFTPPPMAKQGGRTKRCSRKRNAGKQFSNSSAVKSFLKGLRVCIQLTANMIFIHLEPKNIIERQCNLKRNICDCCY